LQGRNKKPSRHKRRNGGDYRRGGRWRLEERRKMAVIRGEEEDGD
jgi:hypothetical protein